MNTTFLRATVAGVALLTVAGAANAADMYRKAPPATPIAAPVTAYNWTGLYAGVNLGGDFARDKLGAASTGSINPGTVFGGLQGGYNFQTGPWVLGAEADVGYGRAKGTNGAVSFEKNWSGTVRARAGYAFDNVLVYGTGGLAWANFKLADGVDSRTTTRAGWTVGGGLEYAVNRNISVKGEYLYADYGEANVGVTSHDLSDHLVRVGVNYRF